MHCFLFLKSNFYFHSYLLIISLLGLTNFRINMCKKIFEFQYSIFLSNTSMYVPAPGTCGFSFFDVDRYAQSFDSQFSHVVTVPSQGKLILCWYQLNFDTNNSYFPGLCLRLCLYLATRGRQYC